MKRHLHIVIIAILCAACFGRCRAAVNENIDEGRALADSLAWLISYPRDAVAGGRGGSLLLRLTVGDDGRARNIRVDSGRGGR